ncbi:GNAT family N-acetyltransferase [Alkalihalobacillus sp. R86527]|uniref:GNAT family N-acetyltransferase n=1 Tax=Alkalihalobacillus sp. R86527 TaxID=3093863 RepID=UPI003671A48C
MVYLRERNPVTDDPKLVGIGIDNFDVPAEKIQRIIKQAYEVLVVCDKHHHVVGFLSYRLRVNHMILVDYVMLRHDIQGSGIARSLLPAFEKHIRSNGITAIYGLVDKENEQIESLKRLGFVVKGTLLTNYIIEKKLQDYKPEVSLKSNYVKRLAAPSRLKY